MLRVTCSRVRMAVISRFLKDMQYFVNLTILDYLTSSPEASTVGDSDPFVMEIDLFDFRLILPRNSWSFDFFTLDGSKVRFTL